MRKWNLEAEGLQVCWSAQCLLLLCKLPCSVPAPSHLFLPLLQPSLHPDPFILSTLGKRVVSMVSTMSVIPWSQAGKRLGW